MSDVTRAFNACMGKYQQEVVRWNRQINLVSRQDTLRSVANLVGQSRDAWLQLEGSVIGSWARSDVVWYFDIGSGGGVPGFVWHQLLSGGFGQVSTWLVEPRGKRAWFLERLNQVVSENPYKVWNSHWGQQQVGRCGRMPQRVLVSLKALNLTDGEVLAGFEDGLGSHRLDIGVTFLIVRFYPAQQRWSRDLAKKLDIQNVPRTVGGHVYVPRRQCVLAPNPHGTLPAALVVSEYLIK